MFLLVTGAVITLVATRLHLYANFFQPLSFMLGFTYFGRCVEFIVGTGLAYWLKRKEAAAAPRGTTLAAVFFIMACLGGMMAVQHGYQATDAWPASKLHIFINNFILPFGVAGLLFGLVKERTKLQQLLEISVFDLPGKSSYAFYLIQNGLL